MKHHQIANVEFRYPIGLSIAYNYPIFIDLANKFIECAKTEIEEKDIIKLICRGSSGAIIATIFYQKIQEAFPEQKIHIVHIKKDNEQSHSNQVEGLHVYNEQEHLYVWIDDHINTGETLEACKHAIINRGPNFKEFKFNWVVCLSSDRNLEYHEKFTHNLLTHIKHH